MRRHVPVALVVLLVLGAVCSVEALTPACVHGLACLGALQGGTTIAADAGVVALAGVFLVGFRLCWTHVRVQRTLAALSLPPSPRLGALQRQLGVRSVAELPTPEPTAFCAGFARPRVYVSEGLLDHLADAELAAVLAHEAAHARHRDPLRLAVASLVADLCFAVPAVGHWRRGLVRRLELRADDAAISSSGRSAVAGALLAVRAKSSNGGRIEMARRAQLAGLASVPEHLPRRDIALSIMGLAALAVPLLCLAEALLVVVNRSSL